MTLENVALFIFDVLKSRQYCWVVRSSERAAQMFAATLRQEKLELVEGQRVDSTSLELWPRLFFPHKLTQLSLNQACCLHLIGWVGGPSASKDKTLRMLKSIHHWGERVTFPTYCFTLHFSSSPRGCSTCWATNFSFIGLREQQQAVLYQFSRVCGAA